MFKKLLPIVAALLVAASVQTAHAQTTTGRFGRLILNSACVVRTGTGTPEGAVTGNICDLYLRTNGGAGTVLYVKESGTGNTGWVTVATGSAGAPTSATYITQTADAGLSAEQALGALATGLMNNTTTTGVVSTIAPTDDNLVVGSGSAWQLKALTDCDSASSAVTYDTTTNAFGCNSISGGGAGWTLVTSATPSGTGGIMSFNNLSAYNEILLLYKGIRGTPDFNFTSRVRVSTNNGSTYLNSSGDYVSLSTQGVETNESDMKMHGTISGGLKTGWRIISNFNTTRPKNSWTPLDGGSYVIPTSSALDAIQIFTSTGLDWDTVGTIYIFGR